MPVVPHDMVFVYDLNDLLMLTEKRIATLKQGPKDKLIACVWGVIDRLGILKPDPSEVEEANVMVDLGVDVAHDNFLKQAYQRFSQEFDIGTNLSFPRDWSSFVERWQIVKNCLQLVIQKSSQHTKYANVAICEDEIVHGAAKLDTFGFLTDITLDNVYSNAMFSTESVLKSIRNRFGPTCKIVVVSSKEETILDAFKLSMFPWPVFSNSDFTSLHTHQRDLWFLQQPDEEEKSDLDLSPEQILQQQQEAEAAAYAEAVAQNEIVAQQALVFAELMALLQNDSDDN